MLFFITMLFVVLCSLLISFSSNQSHKSNNGWWDNYRNYLKSDNWKQKRNKILARDNYSCRSCGNRANQVHHLTYQRVGNENDTDLISLCTCCHNGIHNK